MRLATLRMEGFRNLAPAELVPGPRLTLLVGPNGQGKTNVLEAVHLLLTGQPLRTEQARECIAWDGDHFSLAGVVDSDTAGRIHLAHSLSRQPHSRRRTGPVLPVVAFRPDDLELVKGGPEGRRRYLDLAIAPVDARYRTAWQRYQRALAQRNRSLRDWAAATGSPRHALEGVLEGYARLLAAEGAYVWRARRQFLEALAPYVGEASAQVGAGERLRLRLVPGGTREPAEEPAAFLAALASRGVEERQRGVTLVGPHRDEVVLELDGREAGRFGSQGQQRTVALALRLALFHWFRSRWGEAPVVLLDDVFSELDQERRRRLLAFVAGAEAQTLVTDTEGGRYRDLRPVVLAVEAGHLVREA
ncbi:MAG: DNA replication and repair protein RecF [Firmicutes bacterium]|nr:DNA replication and repair protein RecF [Bacillota bacterium]